MLFFLETMYSPLVIAVVATARVFRKVDSYGFADRFDTA
jgi:hypothetical protein